MVEMIDEHLPRSTKVVEDWIEQARELSSVDE